MTDAHEPARGERARARPEALALPRTLFDDSHRLFRQSFRRFVQDEMLPRNAEWEKAGIVDRGLFLEAGRHGFLGMAVPEEYGGAGIDDFRFNLVIAEELARAGLQGAGLGITLHNDIVLPYLLRYTTPEQKRRWLPGVVSGELITAIAMTEPGAGSDLAGISTTAVRDGDAYVVNGSKTFITNGVNADLVVTVVKTDPAKRHRGMSLLVVERGTDGFERGRNLDKIGQHAQDTAELFFNDCRVPLGNLLGNEGEGFFYLVNNLPQERLSIAMTGVAVASTVLEQTVSYVQQRHAFGQPVGAFQNTRFELATLRTEVELAQVFIDRCVEELNRGALTAEQAAMAKWWCTELQKRTADRCLQLFGGFGYMAENPVARAFVDGRVTTIYGGTTEIMKEIIGRAMGL
jgi:alkylation response protein AidB-like acyl-CoA dehydrogenase